MLADTMKIKLSGGEQVQGVESWLCLPKSEFGVVGSGTQGRTEQASDKVGLRSEVWSRDLGLRTIYFHGEAALWKGFDQTDLSKPWGSPIFEEKARSLKETKSLEKERGDTGWPRILAAEAWDSEGGDVRHECGHCAQVLQRGEGEGK